MNFWRYQLIWFVFFANLAILTSCGGDNITKVSTAESPMISILSTGEKLPACSLEKNGLLLYAKDSLALYCCVNEKWKRITGAIDNGTDTILVTDTLQIHESWTDTINFQTAESIFIGCEITEDTLNYHRLNVSCPNASFVVKDAFANKRHTQKATPLVDKRDGNTYKTVIIGTAVWMAEDLRYVQEECGECQYVTWKNEVKYSWLSAMNFPEGCEKESPCDVGDEYYQGICPEGWHLPNKKEWEQLISYVDSINGDEPVYLDLISGDYGNDLFGLNLADRSYIIPTQGDGYQFYILVPWSMSELRGDLPEIVVSTSNRAKLDYAMRCVMNL